MLRSICSQVDFARAFHRGEESSLNKNTPTAQLQSRARLAQSAEHQTFNLFFYHKEIIMEKSELQSTCCGQFVLKLTLQGLFTEESRVA